MEIELAEAVVAVRIVVAEASVVEASAVEGSDMPVDIAEAEAVVVDTAVASVAEVAGYKGKGRNTG